MNGVRSAADGGCVRSAADSRVRNATNCLRPRLSCSASRLRSNRRGMVFLLIALLLVAVFLTIIFSRVRPTKEDRTESIVSRILTIDSFLGDFHSDADRAAYIAGFRAFIALEEYLSERGSFVPNATPIFIEAFMNGTVDNQSYGVMENSTFSDYLARVNAEAAAVGIGVNASVRDIRLNQSTPWSVDITFVMTVNVTDLRGLARWDYEKNFTTEVSILDIRDPVYSVYTLGRLPNTIRISPYSNSDLVDGNDTTNLDHESTLMYYREDPHAPSFLQRLGGELGSSSKYGIASLVDLDELDAQGLFVHTYLSVVDYVYFSNTTTTVYCPGFGEPLPVWLKLDATHALDGKHDYGFAELNATTCP